tara:strand:+ start:1694 stop:3289 length:1596 start_codon:yes stop_codon:yes gene_type:complete
MILTKSEYLEKIDSLLQDNSTQLISPLDIRISLRDLVDSVHLFTADHNIQSNNFATPETRSTLAGDLALGKLKYAGRTSVDNSAFGYYALGANHEGAQNTAVGSHSLGCNLHGTYNTAVGFNSTAGNTTGSGNTAIGSLSLQTLRDGSFNIAIGHGAGSHIPKDHSYKFYLGVDPIDSGYDCDSMINTSGAVPLMYGDLQERVLAVATQSIHPHGTLQVSGDITPSHSGKFNLGNSSRPWFSVNEVIHFSGSPVKVGVGTSTPSGDQGLLTVAGNIVPDVNGTRSIGWSDGTVNGRKLLWDGYFNDIVVSGNAKINDLQYHTINECLYDCKTLHLATSGVCDDAGLGFHNDAVCGYLNDESVDGGGFVVHSSGYDYQRDYRFLFRNSDPTIKCLEIDNHFSRSRWQSNISIEISSGCHFQGNRVLADHGLSLVKQSGCYGIFTRSEHPSGDKTYISREEHIGAYPTFKDVNFIANSGTHLGSDLNPAGYDYSVMYGTVDSGVKITQEFSSRIKTTSGKRGFSIVYHDELDA